MGFADINSRFFEMLYYHVERERNKRFCRFERERQNVFKTPRDVKFTTVTNSKRRNSNGMFWFSTIPRYQTNVL